MLPFFELDVEETVGGLAPLVDIGHHGIRGQDRLAVNEESYGLVLRQLHALADDGLELDRLEVARDQEPTQA